ncbi:MAG: FecR domain-containing protein [Acidobacteriota bacterium]
MKLDKLMQDIRDQQPETAAIDQAAARVRARLFPAQEANGTAAGTIRGCDDYTALVPAYLAGALDAGRRLLLEVHTRECVHCRKALATARAGARNVIEFTPRKSAGRSYAGWAIAATALLNVSGTAWWAYSEYPALGGGARATVDSIEGALYKVSGSTLIALSPGAELAENDAVSTGKNSTAVLRLNDGSRIELNQRARIFVTRNWAGSTIHLSLGNIIVEAAKQRRGSLQVATADCNVSVKGTVFSVDAGTKGSRVAVVEGTVWVDHGQKHDVLQRGDLTVTSPDMGPVPIRQEFEWSRNSAQYLALLGELGEIRRQIAAIPPPGLRYQSTRLNLLPANVAAIAAIPSVGGTLAEASRIFHDRLKQSEALAAWWNQLPASERTQLEAVILQLQTASGYLGDEIVIAAVSTGKQASPVILAQLTRPGLDSFLKAQLPAQVYEGHMRFDNGLFIVATDPADLNRIGPNGGAASTALFAKLTPAYQQGAGWLFGADLAAMPQARPTLPGVSEARFIVAQSRTMAGLTENRASLTFSRNRQGVASWLSVPGPMGSLEFVSPEAGFAASMLLKNPSLIADDLTGMMSKASGGAEVGGVDLKAELASVFAGEVTVAMDGPLLPFPSWKIAAEVYYPDRLQASFGKLVTAFNSQPNHEKTGDLQLTKLDSDGRTYYKLRFEKLPWEADWTYIDGYWLAAANQELLVRSIQNRQTGFTLPKSSAFRSQLPHDGYADFSAVVYHNLGQTLAPVFDLLGTKPVGPADTPGVICFWAAPDRIDVATVGSIFGMNLESLLSLQGAGPLQMLTKGMASSARRSQ